MGGQDFNEKFYRMCQKTDDLHSAVFDKGGIKETLAVMSVEHAACMDKHRKEQESKERTAELAIQEEKQAKRAWLDKKFAALATIASSPWIFDAIKWFLTPKK